MRSLINRYYSWYFNLNSLKQFGVSFLGFWLLMFCFDLAGEHFFYHEDKPAFKIAISSIFSAFFMAVISGTLMPAEWRKAMWEKRQKERNQKADQ